MGRCLRGTLVFDFSDWFCNLLKEFAKRNIRYQQNGRQFIAFFCVLTHCVKMNYYFFNYEYFFKCAYK